LIYCFGSSAFLISSIVIAKISWSCFRANETKGAAYIIQISRGFGVTSSHFLLQLVVIALSFWFRVRGRGSLYYVKFK